MIIKQLEFLDEVNIKAISELIKECDGYEPFYTDIYDFNMMKKNIDKNTKKNNDSYESDILQIAAFKNDKMIGFASCLTNAHDTELTAMVAPKERNRGIFKEMYYALNKSLTQKYGTNAPKKLLCSISDETAKFLIKSSLKPEYSFSELFFELKKPLHTESANKNNDYDFCFSDDFMNYFLYIGDDDEPAAVCCLDYQDSFTNVYSVFVDEDLRGNGIGTIFIQSLIHDYFAKENRPLFLNVQSTNAPAVKLYQKCGFKEVRCIKYYAISAGNQAAAKQAFDFTSLTFLQQ